MTLTRDDLEPLLREMDRHAAELIVRAANLDYLAGQIDVRTVALEQREREVSMRENDVLMASLELKRWQKQKEDKHAAG
jgi:hypothetical protein